MMTMLRVAVALFALSLLSGCAQQKEQTTPALLSSVCVLTGEALDADSPTSDYMGGKVGFCCEKCQRKWTSLDDAGRTAAFAKHKQ